MYNLKNVIKEREKMLSNLIKKKEEALKMAPVGSLRTTKQGKGFQYYHYMSTGNPHGTYLKCSEQKLISALAQKEYDQKVLRSAYKEYTLLKRLNELYKEGMTEDVFEKMTLAKQHLLTPVWLPDKLYIEQWEGKKYRGLEFREEAPEFYTDKGERVRSKSELLIANALYKKKIPYKYEYPLELKQHGVVYPDFTVLNVKNRKEMYWEHLGLMDDHDYRERNLNKLAFYEMNDYFPGDRLILTFETAKQPLSSRLIELIIDKYLL